MKKFLFIISVIAFISSCISVKSSNDGELVNLIENGDLSNGSEGWGLFVKSPGEGSFEVNEGQIHYNIDNVGTEEWHIQAHYAGLTFIKGHSYTFQVDMASTIPKEAQIRIQLDFAPYTAYLEENIQLTPDMQTFTFDFVMEKDTDEFAKLCYNIGYFEDGDLPAHTVKVDNLSITTDNNTIEEKVEIVKTYVSVNQVGYLTNSSKIVRVNSDVKSFYLKDATTNETVYEGLFGDFIDDPASKDKVVTGDFTAFVKEGQYIIEVPEIGSSVSFEIKSDIFNPLKKSIFEMFYYQRCGFDLDENITHDWTHSACHTDLATVYNTDTKVDVTGGWHDAGDYGRYTSPGIKAVTDLMLTSIFYTETPELYNEIRYELDWLLKMQDPETGGVYHKVTTKKFIDNIMPDKNSDKLIISPISSTATGDFAAVMAMSSRLYREIDPVYSEIALEAALKAWAWLDEHELYPGFKNPEGITTGEYGDFIDKDEKFWASVELFLATENPMFHSYAKESFEGEPWSGLGWADMGTYGVISYIFTDSDVKDDNFSEELRQEFIKKADKISSKSLEDGFGISLGTNYQWGSNEIVADNGIILLLANRLTGNELYKEQALDHLNYLLGINSLGISFVSGFGDVSMKFPHHRPSTFVGKVVPGMLAGGPNRSLQDPFAKMKLAKKAPAKCYLDLEPSYSTNEITIYWNSPLLFLVSGFTE
ncbi:MAG: glycoside hydrolase family 9 protein [Spirochaetaceae bacterium]